MPVSRAMPDSSIDTGPCRGGHTTLEGIRLARGIRAMRATHMLGETHSPRENACMKQQIARFSPHQNGKVFAVLMAISAVVFMVPFMLFGLASAPAEARPHFLFFLAMPILYLVFGYVMVAIGCAVYNVLFKHIGGIEFETRGPEA